MTGPSLRTEISNGLTIGNANKSLTISDPSKVNYTLDGSCIEMCWKSKKKTARIELKYLYINYKLWLTINAPRLVS